MPFTPVRSTTRTGTLLLVPAPLPNWPYLPSPQAQTVPSALSAIPWMPPAEIAFTFVRAATCTGAYL